MIRTIIIYDEQKACFLLRNLLEKNFPNVKILGLAYNIEEAEKLINTHQPDLIFLDIEMPNGNGFKLLEKYANRNINFNVIITTAYKEHAIKAIKFSALDFLLKPIDKNELKQAIDKVIRNKNIVINQKQVEALIKNLSALNGQFVKFGIPSNNKIRFVNPNEIYLIEADGSYSFVYLLDGEKILVSKNLKYFEDLLDNCQVSQGCL
ncbi:MAG: LytTR family DNA-binding domain-containing protein [Marinilabiliales bacterium]